MSAVPKHDLWTVEEYFALDNASDGKYEYLDGQIVRLRAPSRFGPQAFSGASRYHNLITLGVGATLRGALDGKPCEVYSTDMRVEAAADEVYTFPDVVVACGELEFSPHWLDTLLNPILVAEVLSPSTEEYDRGAKFKAYQRVASLREYLLISQERMFVEVYTRTDKGGWLYQTYSDLTGTIELRSVECSLALNDIYKGITFEDDADQ